MLNPFILYNFVLYTYIHVLETDFVDMQAKFSVTITVCIIMLFLLLLLLVTPVFFMVVTLITSDGVIF